MRVDVTDMSLRHRALATTMLTCLAGGPLVAPSLAADLTYKSPAFSPVPYQPGVDGLNWKLGALGGTLADRSLYGGSGSVSIPLAGLYGLQLDGAAGTYDNKFFAAGGAHLFARDPSRGLIGLYASATQWNEFGGLHVGQVAGEGEVYLGQWTIQGIAGVESGNSRTATIGNLVQTYDTKTRFFDKINVAYYATDNWKMFVGHRYLGGKNALALGTEYGFRVNGPLMGAVFVEGRIGENDYHGIWGGLRFYRGDKDKTLIQRHRQDDPIEWTPETLFSIVNTLKTTPVVTPPPPPPCVGDAC
jgi:hypothetical protein